MKIRLLLILSCAACLLSASAWADSTLYHGQLANTTDVFQTTFTLSSPGDVTIQTFGFGGGTTSAGQSISGGGFDPLVALFSGTGDSATIVDGSADVLSNYASYVGCPAAEAVDLGAGPMCGDVRLAFTGLAAGQYTITLSDAGYQPNALTGYYFDSSGNLAYYTTLGDGFSDVGAAFQTCDFDAVGTQYCADRSQNWAFELTTPTQQNPTPTPEPASLLLLGSGLAMCCRKRRP